jgi:hypothetical protein
MLVCVIYFAFRHIITIFYNFAINAMEIGFNAPVLITYERVCV